jgi:hypothetical protein
MSDEVIFDYLKSIYQSILFRDIVARFQVRNIEFLLKLTQYLASETGKLISAQNISKYLKSQNQNISVSAVINYISYLTTALMIFKVNRSDIHGKRIFSVGEKYYFNDIGLRNAVTGFSPFGLGQIIENIVYIHLRIYGYAVYVGKDKDKEVDFVCEKNGEKMYFQVSLRITDKNVMEREFGNLLAIKDNFPKHVITLDHYTGASYQGIIHLPLIEFLTNFR